MKHIHKLITMTSIMLFIAGQAVCSQLIAQNDNEDFLILMDLLYQRKTKPDTVIKMPLSDLKKANLRGTNLRNANFRSADLRDANLSYADLRNADFTRADLHGVDLTYAIVHGAIFIEAKGLSDDQRDYLSFTGRAITQKPSSAPGPWYRYIKAMKILKKPVCIRASHVPRATESVTVAKPEIYDPYKQYGMPEEVISGKETPENVRVWQQPWARYLTKIPLRKFNQAMPAETLGVQETVVPRKTYNQTATRPSPYTPIDEDKLD